MSKITRSDVFIRDEQGGDWFQDFLRSFSENKEAYVQDVLDAINEKRGNSVESVVQQYREATGLDSIADEKKEDKMVSTASMRPLSKRHAHMLQEPGEVIVVIEQDPALKADLESLCEHSGGTKETHAILSFLRDKLGKELVSFSDEDLMKYIEDLKDKYYEEKDEPEGNAGKVGTDSEDNPEDNAADYITHGNGHKG